MLRNRFKIIITSLLDNRFFFEHEIYFVWIFVKSQGGEFFINLFYLNFFSGKFHVEFREISGR
jgi:hypothetical protein